MTCMFFFTISNDLARKLLLVLFTGFLLFNKQNIAHFCKKLLIQVVNGLFKKYNKKIQGQVQWIGDLTQFCSTYQWYIVSSIMSTRLMPKQFTLKVCLTLECIN